MVYRQYKKIVFNVPDAVEYGPSNNKVVSFACRQWSKFEVSGSAIIISYTIPTNFITSSSFFTIVNVRTSTIKAT